MNVNERHLWAAEVLNVQPDDKLLEIGCGPGVTADMVAKRLKHGELHLIDRSQAMTTQAGKRCQRWVAEEKVRVFQNSFALAQLPFSTYDKVYAFNMSLFLKNSATEFERIKELIGDTGSFYFFSQPPFDLSNQVVEDAHRHFQKQGFEVIRVLIAPFQPAPTFCIEVKNK